jgi:hypothetical protein
VVVVVVEEGPRPTDRMHPRHLISDETGCTVGDSCCQ